MILLIDTIDDFFNMLKVCVKDLFHVKFWSSIVRVI